MRSSAKSVLTKSVKVFKEEEGFKETDQGKTLPTGKVEPIQGDFIPDPLRTADASTVNTGEHPTPPALALLVDPACVLCPF